MKYNSIGQQLIAKAKELDPSYKPDKFNDMSEALNIILNNIEISGSNFQIIDVTSDGSLNSIASLYRKINNSQSLNFSNQSSVYNNIATAVNNGLVPILKFTDGYGYYKEFLSSSSEYVFTLNHITKPELATNPANNVITLKIGNTTNKCYYNNLSQIPTTVVISSGAFGDSGSLTSAESKNLNKLLTTARYNLSAGIFILNNVDKKIYYVTESKSGNFNTLMAYTINQNSVEVLNFTYSRGVFNYTKKTYALGGGGGKLEGFTIDVSGTYNSETKNFTGTLTDEQWTKVQNEQIYWIEVVYINNQEIGEETTASTTLLYSGPFLGVGRAFINSNGSMMIIFDKSISGMIADIVLKMDAQNKPTSQLIPSITTSNTQQNLTIGNGLTIENGVLKTTGGGSGSASKMLNLGNLTDEGTLDAGKFQELMTLLENGDLIQATFSFNDGDYITANAYSNGSSLDIVAYNVSNSLNAVKLSINPEDRNYTITTIEISGGGSATKMVNLGTLSQSGTLDAGKLQELMTLFQNGDLIQATFVFSESQFITASAYSIGSSSMGIVAHAVLADFGSAAVVDLSINTANGNYAITPIELPLRFKTINDSSLIGNGNINLQETLVSGSNIKTINGQSLLGSGDLPITTDITYATDNEVNNLFTNPGQPIPDKTISLENLNAFKQQINNEIGKVLEEGF